MMTAKILSLLSVLGGILVSILAWQWPFGRAEPSLILLGIVEIQEVRLASRVGGRVLSVDAERGRLVSPGQVLVTLERGELDARKAQMCAELRAARAGAEKAHKGPRPEEILAARESVQAAEARLRRLRAGPRPEELEQARAELASWDAERARAVLDAQRERWLGSRGAGSEAHLETAVATRNRLDAQLRMAQARLRLLEAGTRSEEIAEGEAELRRVQAGLDLLLAGTRSEDKAEAEARVAQAEARLREIETQLAETTISAPEAMVLEVVTVRPGDVVQPFAPVVRGLRADDLWVKAYIPETELGRIRLGQAVEVTCDSYRGQRFAGTIMRIASVSEFTPRNVQSADERRHQVFAFEVRVADPQGVFKSGMAAEVIVPLDH